MALWAARRYEVRLTTLPSPISGAEEVIE